jgi:hypothetical protein
MRLLLEEAYILLARLGCSVEVSPFFDGKPDEQADLSYFAAFYRIIVTELSVIRVGHIHSLTTTFFLRDSLKMIRNCNYQRMLITVLKLKANLLLCLVQLRRVNARRRWKYSSTYLNIDITLRWVFSFTLRLLYPRENKAFYSAVRRLCGHQTRPERYGEEEKHWAWCDMNPTRYNLLAEISGSPQSWGLSFARFCRVGEGLLRLWW